MGDYKEVPGDTIKLTDAEVCVTIATPYAFLT